MARIKVVIGERVSGLIAYFTVVVNIMYSRTEQFMLLLN